jgi:hypothetical protein
VTPAAAVQNAFLDLFRTEGRGAVSAAVSELWGAPRPVPQPDTVAALNGKPPAAAGRVRPVEPLRTSRSPT